MEDLKVYTERLEEGINKYETLKWILREVHFRYNDELFAFKKKLTDNWKT